MLRKLICSLALTFAMGVAAPSVHAVIIYQDDFESGSLGPEWTTFSSTANGRVQVSSVVGAPANDGSFHLVMDRDPAGDFNLNEAILTVDLSGFSNVFFSFAHKDVNDEDLSLPPSFVGSVNGDGVSMSADGSNWFRLVSLNDSNSPNLVYTGFAFDLSAEALTAGISLGSNFQLKFQQFDNFPFNTDGRTFDSISISGTAIPEPTALLLMGLGLAGLGFVRRRHNV